jgi:DNA-binding SARP family transcriptional activator
MLEFSLLGPLEVRAGGRVLDLGGQRQRVLLIALLLEPNRVVASDRLIESVWDEQPTATAHKGLQVLVSQLRKALGRERVESRPPGYRIVVEPGELDVDVFLELRNDGRIEDALALWRGAPLADVAYHRFAQAEIARLAELRLATLEDRIDRDLGRGLSSELVAELEALTRAYPSRERLTGQLLVALYRSGRQADALDAYRIARGRLVEELGIEPGPRLRELHRLVLRQDASLEVDAGCQPPPRQPFVGRAAELAELAGALEQAVGGRGALVLLEGEPGIGKSYLADAFLRDARRRGARTLAGRAWESGGAPAYWPWVQPLRTCLRDVGAEELRALVGPAAVELVRILPELGDPVAPSSPDDESEASRFRLFDEVTGVLRRLAESGPVVLFLDDVHAADPSSLLLLEFVTRELASIAMLVIGAYRSVDPEPSEALTATLTELVREPVTRVVSLRGLNPGEVAE